MKTRQQTADADVRALAAPIAPVMVSQRTSEQVLGLPERHYRELIQREAVPHTRRGKLVLARVSDVVAAIERRDSKPPAPESNRERLRRVAGLGGGK